MSKIIVAAVAGLAILGGCIDPNPDRLPEAENAANKPGSAFSSKVERVIDSHTHLFRLTRLERYERARLRLGIDRMNIACIVGPNNGQGNTRGLYAKAAGAGTLYCFGGLNHSAYKSGGKVKTPSLADQVDELMAAGYDGIKLIEGKPSVRRDWYPFAPDSDYYREFFARVEKRGVPLLWHVADPIEYWSRKTPPSMSKDQLYTEAENVLDRHPKLRVIFAHFFFMASDLDRLGKFFTDHPNTHVDMALGKSTLYHLSDDPVRSREFFIKFQDHILFGTDMSDRNALEFANGKGRARIIRRFLETSDTFTLPGWDGPKGGPLRGPGGRTKLRGLSLPKEVLSKIYAGNFERIVGREPKKVDLAKAMDYCRRAAAISAALGGTSPDKTVGGETLEAFRRLADAKAAGK